MTQVDPPFSGEQLSMLHASFQKGAADASRSLAKWLGKPSLMTLESVEQSALHEATGLLATDDPICFCSMRMPDTLPGELIVAFDDASGLSLADMVLQRPARTANQWGDIEKSAALESTNIICCAYLNALVADLSTRQEFPELIPQPPEFRRDFAESLLEFALMSQATQSDQSFLVRTKFQVDNEPLNWTLLWVPDATAIQKLRAIV